jgi:hypothetical protein
VLRRPAGCAARDNAAGARTAGARRVSLRTKATRQPSLASIYCAKPTAAVRWLADAFSLGARDEFGDADSPEHRWIEFRIGNCSVMLSRSTATAARMTLAQARAAQ